MFDSIKRFFSKPAAGRNLREVFEWAERSGRDIRRVKGDEGFVIDGAFQGKPWRLEWGPAQRAYIEGHELRIRMELHLPPDQQMLLLSRPLMDTLALAYAADNKIPKAIETQKLAIARAPNDPSLKLTLAKLLIKSGDKAYARAELEDLVKLGDGFREQAEVATLLKSL